jgi:DNA helicase HerA-like ATPase
LTNGIQGFIKLPFVVVVEEANNFVPAHPLTDAERASTQLTKTITSEGRKFGVGLIMISQRPSRLDNTALTMCNSFIIMRLVNAADQRFVKAVIETVGEEEAKLLPDLDRGEALISGQCVQFVVSSTTHSGRGWPSRRHLWIAYSEKDTTDDIERVFSGRHPCNRPLQRQRPNLAPQH